VKATCRECKSPDGSSCWHAVGFVMWLHRRSEEPAKKWVHSYWCACGPPAPSESQSPVPIAQLFRLEKEERQKRRKTRKELGENKKARRTEESSDEDDDEEGDVEEEESCYSGSGLGYCGASSDGDTF